MTDILEVKMSDPGRHLLQRQLWVCSGFPDMQDVEVDTQGRVINVSQQRQRGVDRIGQGAGVCFHHQGQAFICDATGQRLQTSGLGLALPPVKLGAALMAAQWRRLGWEAPAVQREKRRRFP